MNRPQIEFIGNLTHPPRKVETNNQAQPMTALQIAVNTLRGRDVSGGGKLSRSGG